MSVLIWVKTVCKGYQQTTKVAPSEERGDKFSIINRNRTLWGHINSLQTIFFYVIVFWSITNGSARNP